jgi:tetratricopeptide (TPR) repeat protein
MFDPRSVLLGLVSALVLIPPPPGLAATPPGELLSQAQELLDNGQPREALDLLDRIVSRRPKHAEAYFLRSTAHFLLDEVSAGRRDLLRSLELDPSLRQGWLNRAALELSEGQLEAALTSLTKARDLDPTAEDNDLNLGAVKLLLGELGAATDLFQRYLRQQAWSAEAHYLVATNYAMAGYAALGIQHLGNAIQLDERSRLRARTDPNFAGLASNPQLQQLLLTDRYQPPPGAHRADRIYDSPYEGEDSLLLGALLDALQLSGEAFDRRVEVTPDWALIWGEMRIKVSRASPEEGRVEITAPANRFTPSEWRRRSTELLDSVFIQLQKRRWAASKGS